MLKIYFQWIYNFLTLLRISPAGCEFPRQTQPGDLSFALQTPPHPCNLFKCNTGTASPDGNDDGDGDGNDYADGDANGNDADYNGATRCGEWEGERLLESRGRCAKLHSPNALH